MCWAQSLWPVGMRLLCRTVLYALSDAQKTRWLDGMDGMDGSATRLVWCIHKKSEKYNTQKKHLAIIYTNTGISSTSTGSHMVNNLTQSYIVYFLSVFQLFCAKCSHEIHHPPLCCKTRSWPAVPLPPSQHCRRCKRCCFGFYQHDEASGISQPTDFFERSADEDATRMQNNT